ncbi:hypothetical protein HX744_26160 [Pseudonocardia sp. ICBG1122]|nr:hypothetical protein [Pseudonocardia pini]
MLTGTAGAGRTTALRSIGQTLGADRPVVSLRFTVDGVLTPTVRPAGRAADDHNALVAALGSRAGARSDRTTAQRVGHAGAGVLLDAGDGVLLVDDAQWADLDVLAAVEVFVRRLRGTAARCVVAVRTPGPEPTRSAGLALLGRLRAEGLVAVERVAALDTEGVARVLRRTIGARPDRELVDEVQATSRGVRAAVDDVVRALGADDAIRVLDGHAYLARSSRPATVGDQHLLDSLRLAGPETWAAARALALMQPLGPAVPGLLATAMGTSERVAHAHLAALHDAGFVHRGLGGREWRFHVPALADAVRAALGPFERRRLSALVVEAVWAGRAHSADDRFLTDRVAEAGNLVDVKGARDRLADRAAAVMTSNPRDARRWWRAAAELATDPGEHARMKFMEVMACHLGGDYGDFVMQVRPLLDEAAELLPTGLIEHAYLALVQSIWLSGDRATTEAIAGGETPIGADAATVAMSQVVALSFLERWSEVGLVLDARRGDWLSEPFTQSIGELLGAMSDFFGGSPRSFDERLANGYVWSRNSGAVAWRDHINASVSVLLDLLELPRVDAVLADADLAESELHPSNRATIALMRCVAPDGDDLLDQARRVLAAGPRHGHDAGRASLAVCAVTLMVGRGRLTAARELVARSRERNPAVRHLLEDCEARIDTMLGDHDRARERVEAALGSCAELGIVAGTELLRVQLVGLALARGDQDEARKQVGLLERVAERMSTSRAAVLLARSRALVERDPDAARECLSLARDRELPWEYSLCRLQLIEQGLLEPDGLVEVYATWGHFDALLHRAWTRNAMSEHGLAIPGRQAVVEENQRLLATLAAEGLSNRQIAATLRTSEKSVESRLSRLLTSTGYRSRIELVGAIARGEFDHGGSGRR